MKKETNWPKKYWRQWKAKINPSTLFLSILSPHTQHKTHRLINLLAAFWWSFLNISCSRSLFFANFSYIYTVSMINNEFHCSSLSSFSHQCCCSVEHCTILTVSTVDSFDKFVDNQFFCLIILTHLKMK